MLCNINANYNGKAIINKYLNRKESLKNAKYIVKINQNTGKRAKKMV